MPESVVRITRRLASPSKDRARTRRTGQKNGRSPNPMSSTSMAEGGEGMDDWSSVSDSASSSESDNSEGALPLVPGGRRTHQSQAPPPLPSRPRHQRVKRLPVRKNATARGFAEKEKDVTAATTGSASGTGFYAVGSGPATAKDRDVGGYLFSSDRVFSGTRNPARQRRGSWNLMQSGAAAYPVEKAAREEELMVRSMSSSDIMETEVHPSPLRSSGFEVYHTTRAFGPNSARERRHDEYDETTSAASPAASQSYGFDVKSTDSESDSDVSIDYSEYDILNNRNREQERALRRERIMGGSKVRQPLLSEEGEIVEDMTGKGKPLTGIERLLARARKIEKEGVKIVKKKGTKSGGGGSKPWDRISPPPRITEKGRLLARKRFEEITEVGDGKDMSPRRVEMILSRYHPHEIDALGPMASRASALAQSVMKWKAIGGNTWRFMLVNVSRLCAEKREMRRTM